MRIWSLRSEQWSKSLLMSFFLCGFRSSTNLGWSINPVHAVASVLSVSRDGMTCIPGSVGQPGMNLQVLTSFNGHNKILGIQWLILETKTLVLHWLVVTGWWWLVAIFHFPIYWVANHPNWLSYFSEGWPNHQPARVYFKSTFKSWKQSRFTVVFTLV